VRHSSNRILTTHVGSLARPANVLDLLWAKERREGLVAKPVKLVCRENVIGGADCGFASFAAKEQEIHPSIVWAKFKNLAEGARIASKKLWA